MIVLSREVFVFRREMPADRPKNKARKSVYIIIYNNTIRKNFQVFYKRFYAGFT